MNQLSGEFIGNQLKMLRISHDKRIDEISKVTGFSKGYLSLLENGRRVPNYRALRKILLNGFGETLSSFFAKVLSDGANPGKKLLYQEPISLCGEQGNIIVEILLPIDASNGAELVRLTLLPEAVFDEEFKTSFRVYGHVLKGEVILKTSTETKLNPGNSFFYEGIRFSLSNISKDKTEMFLVFTPPAF
jgi:transcriptional regulator with XRE-family HTH domain